MPSVSRSHRATPASGQVSGRAVEGVFRLHAILGEEGLDDAVFDHHRVVEHGHVGHAAVGVAAVDIVAEQPVLFRRRHGRNPPREEIAVAVDHAPHRAARLELVDENAHRDAGVAAFAVRHVRDVLAATETALQQIVDQPLRLLVREVREELAFEPPRQIRARLWCGDIELGKVLLLLAHSPRLNGRMLNTLGHRSRQLMIRSGEGGNQERRC